MEEKQIDHANHIESMLQKQLNQISSHHQVTTRNKSHQKNHNSIDNQDDVDSDWSLESLEDLKAVNLKLLQEEDEENGHPEKAHQSKPAMVVKVPEKPIILANAALHEVGKIICQVGELMIIQAVKKGNEKQFVVDLDNWICDSNKNWIGFVMDVFGKIEKPYYAIKYELDDVKLKEIMFTNVYYIEGMQICYVGTEKILKDEDLKSMMSKSAIDAEEGEGEDLEESDNQDKIERDFSSERVAEDQPRHDQGEHSKWRRQDKPQEERRQNQRSRTRDHYQQNNQVNTRTNRWESSWQDKNTRNHKNQSNQKYLESMYTLHYKEMMKLCHSAYQSQPFQSQPIQSQPIQPAHQSQSPMNWSQTTGQIPNNLYEFNKNVHNQQQQQQQNMYSYQQKPQQLYPPQQCYPQQPYQQGYASQQGYQPQPQQQYQSMFAMNPPPMNPFQQQATNNSINFSSIGSNANGQLTQNWNQQSLNHLPSNQQPPQPKNN